MGADSGSDRGGTPQVSPESLSAEDYQRSSASICGSKLVPWCLGGEKEAPEELEIPLLAAARGVALGEETGAVARETGHAAEEIARWAFIYAKAWDRAYWPARLEAAEFGAALAINRLLDFVAGPDPKLAARAGRTLLIHRRHMHWARENPPQRHRDTEEDVSLDAARASSRTDVLLRGPKGISVPQCLCGEKGWRSRDGP